MILIYESILIASATENRVPTSICSMGHFFISTLHRLVPPPTFARRYSFWVLPTMLNIIVFQINFNSVSSLFQGQHAPFIFEERVWILRRQEIWLWSNETAMGGVAYLPVSDSNRHQGSFITTRNPNGVVGAKRTKLCTQAIHQNYLEPLSRMPGERRQMPKTMPTQLFFYQTVASIIISSSHLFDWRLQAHQYLPKACRSPHVTVYQLPISVSQQLLSTLAWIKRPGKHSPMKSTITQINGRVLLVYGRLGNEESWYSPCDLLSKQGPQRHEWNGGTSHRTDSACFMLGTFVHGVAVGGMGCATDGVCKASLFTLWSSRFFIRCLVRWVAFWRGKSANRISIRCCGLWPYRQHVRYLNLEDCLPAELISENEWALSIQWALSDVICQNNPFVVSCTRYCRVGLLELSEVGRSVLRSEISRIIRSFETALYTYYLLSQSMSLREK